MAGIPKRPFLQVFIPYREIGCKHGNPDFLKFTGILPMTLVVASRRMKP
jgi:hypothetical protein